MQVLIELVLVEAPPLVGERLEVLAAEEPDAAWSALRLLANEPTGEARVSSWPSLLTRDEVAGEIVVGRSGPVEETLRFEIAPHLADGSLDLDLALDLAADEWRAAGRRVDWRGVLRVGDDLACVALGADLLLVVSSTVVTGEDVLQELVDEKRARDEALPDARRARRRALRELLGV